MEVKFEFWVVMPCSIVKAGILQHYMASQPRRRLEEWNTLIISKEYAANNKVKTKQTAVIWCLLLTWKHACRPLWQWL